MEFNYALSNRSPDAIEPEYQGGYGSDMPPIQAKGNLSYLKYIDLLEHFWKKEHPEIIFQPVSPRRVYDPEKGYVIYQLDQRVPKQGDTKPRFMARYKDTEDENTVIRVFRQSFQNVISFTAIHTNPRTAEEIIEAFEDFMLDMGPVFKEAGIEEMVYARRISDDHEKRFGEDVAARTLLMMVTTQKLIAIENVKLKEIVGECRMIIAKTEE